MNQRGRDRALGEQLKLRGQRVGIVCADALQKRAHPLPTLLLELQCDPYRRVLRVAQLADRIDVGTTTVVGFREDALEMVEVAEELLARRRVRRRNVPEACDQVGRDEVVLGRVVVIERALADARFRRHGVHPDGANPVVIEELVRRGEDAFGRGGACGVGRGHI